MSNQGRRWFEQKKDFVGRPKDAAAADVPDLFVKCDSCGATMYAEELAAEGFVCPSCQHHHRVGSRDRLEMLCDVDSLVVHDADLAPVDALRFVDSKPYGKRIAAAIHKTGMHDAYLAASGEIEGIPVEVGSFEFGYMGGSMGSVVGEVITRQIERAIAGGRPAIIVSASGGARMQEGVLSLMQMAKTSAALARLRATGQPYISVLTHPTTGGVAASFAMLGDIILSEPGALVGFAGPRVIRETIGQELPDGFQTAEYLLAHGMVDRIVPRRHLRGEIALLLRHLCRLPESADGNEGGPRPDLPAKPAPKARLERVETEGS